MELYKLFWEFREAREDAQKVATLKTYKGFAGKNAGVGVGVVEGERSGRGIWLELTAFAKENTERQIQFRYVKSLEH